MIIFYDPVPISQNPNRYRITYTARGVKGELVEGRTNWIEVPNQELGAIDAWVVENGALVLAKLLPYRSEAVATINERANEANKRVLADSSVLSMILQEQEKEALAYLAENPAPADLSNYPFMEAEVGPGLTAATALELAQFWGARAAQWRGLAAQIQNIRVAHIEIVNLAPDLTAINQVVASATDILSQIQP